MVDHSKSWISCFHDFERSNCWIFSSKKIYKLLIFLFEADWNRLIFAGQAGKSNINPIENLWPQLRAAVTPPGQYGLSNAEMRRRATVWFHHYSVADCRAAMSSMVSRMQQLSAAHFWSIAH